MDQVWGETATVCLKIDSTISNLKALAAAAHGKQRAQAEEEG